MSVEEKEFDEMGRLWRSEPLGPESASGRAALAQVRSRARGLDRAVFRRNLCEVAAGALVLGVMGWTSWLAPGWWPKAGAVAATASIVFVLGRLLRARREHPPVPPDLPTVRWLEAEIAKVAAEIRLLRSVVSWYVAPLAVGATIWCVILVSVGLSSIPISTARAALAVGTLLVLCGALFGLVGWGVWRVNRLGIERQLWPYAEELRSLRSAVLSEAEQRRAIE